MNSYWVGIALLLLSASAFVLWALLRKLPMDQVVEDIAANNLNVFTRQRQELDQELQAGMVTKAEYTAREIELKRALLSDIQQTKQPSKYYARGGYLLVFTALCLPLAGWFTYGALGAKPALEQRYQQQYTQTLMASTESVSELIAVLEAELKAASVPQQTHNAYAWFILANAYIQEKSVAKGLQAFTIAAQQVVDNPRLHSRILSQHAQVMFALDGTFSTRVNEALQKALTINSQDATALGLMGIKAYESQAFSDAIQYWQQALANSQSEDARQLLEVGIANAQQQLATATKAVDNTVNLSVNIRLANGLQLPTDDRAVIFVYARVAGQSMPLLATKLAADDLPKQLVLDDSMALLADTDFTQYAVVELVAHIAVAGTPGQQPGDLVGMVAQVSVAEQEVIDLVIDQIVTQE